jgi:Tfp pilus assembly protein PilW
VSSAPLRDESGYSLVELLLATAAALVIGTAALMLVVASLHLSSTYTDRVDSNQLGRTAMEKVVQVLHSSCVASNIAPVLAGSDDNNLIVYSVLAAQPTLQPNEVEISYASGSLTMATSPYLSGSSPADWRFSSPANEVLLQHATAATINGATQPSRIFQYFGYSGTAISTTPFATPLSSADAASTAMVTVTFQAIPSSGNSAMNRGVALSNSVVLRLSPASGSATAVNGACA